MIVVYSVQDLLTTREIWIAKCNQPRRRYDYYNWERKFNAVLRRYSCVPGYYNKGFDRPPCLINVYSSEELRAIVIPHRFKPRCIGHVYISSNKPYRIRYAMQHRQLCHDIKTSLEEVFDVMIDTTPDLAYPSRVRLG